MSKSQKPQVTTTNSQVVMPEYVQDAQKNLLSTGQNVLAPYLNAGTSGYGVAGFNQDQTDAFQGARQSYVDAFTGKGALDPSEITKFLNPYTQNVVDTTNQNLRDQNDITLNGIRARAAAGSSFGGSGSRAALMETAANKDLGNTIASTTAQLMSQGYDKATATAMASHTQDLAYRQSALQGLLGVGNQQQQLAQTQMDVPLTALQRLSGITPQQYGSSTSGTTVAPPPQGPSGLQQGLGAGLSILGMGMPGAAGAAGAAATGGTLGGSLFSSMLPMLALSDRNAKTDIKKLGEDPDTGLPMYAYRYKGDPKNTPKTVGPMAQDIEKRFPGTTQDIGGHKVVNASALRSILGV